MAKSKGLGRGLDAIMLGGAGPELEPETQSAPNEGEAVIKIKLGDIDPNKNQPRRYFDVNALNELAESIKSVGVLQPIIVARAGGRYSIIAGERRWRAAKLAGLGEIPAIVREYDEERRLEAALIENLQRDDLNPVEEAAGIRSLMDRFSLTQEVVAARLGKSRPAVANSLRLLSLPEEVLTMLREGRLSAGHARALAGVSDAETQVRLARLAAEGGLSVRQLERECARQAETAENKEADEGNQRAMNPEMRSLERMAREAFGIKAEISGDEGRGRLTLHYYSPDDLQRIWDVLELISQSES